MSVKIQHRRDTEANWTTNNPTLSAGELGFELDTNKFKIGNGVDDWNTLSYTVAETSELFLEGGNAYTIHTPSVARTIDAGGAT